MENAQLQNTNTIANIQTYSISEITARYKKLNEDLVKVLDALFIIMDAEWIEDSDIELFKKSDIYFEELNIKEDELIIHGNLIYINIFETVFEESLEKASEVFIYSNPEMWFASLEEFNKLIIKLGMEVSFMLMFVSKLCKTMTTIALKCNVFDNDEQDEDNICLLEFCDFNIASTRAMKIPDLKKRIQYYYEEIASKELYCIGKQSEPFRTELCKNFINKCNQAIKITTKQLNNIENLETQNLITIALDNTKTESTEPNVYPETTKNPAFTTSRQVLAIYYLLNEIDRRGINQIDKTEKAKFIEFLTGKNYNNIYKVLSNPFKGLDKQNPKNFLNDIEYIKMHFENLGLQSIVQKINADVQQDE